MRCKLLAALGYERGIMMVGIIGADDRAVTIGRLFHHCGHSISFSDPRGVEAAQKAAQALGNGTVSTPHEQAVTCQALVLTVHWEDLDRTLSAIGTYQGLVIDATRPPALRDESGAERLARKLDNGHVVKAFVDVTGPMTPVEIASDDTNARELIEAIIRDCGGTTVDKGSLAHAAEIERRFARRATLYLTD